MLAAAYRRSHICRETRLTHVRNVIRKTAQYNAKYLFRAANRVSREGSSFVPSLVRVSFTSNPRKSTRPLVLDLPSENSRNRSDIE